MKNVILLIISLLIFQSCTEKNNNEMLYTDFSIYLTNDSLVRDGLKLDKVISDKVLIKYEDIIFYDSSLHIFELRFKTDTLFQFSKNYDGRGFVAVLNNTIKVYCGVLWSPLHSSTNPNITITLPMNNTSNNYQLEVLENYHDTTFTRGYAQINDSRVIALLKSDKKLK